MSDVVITPATAADWPEVEHALTGGGDGASCWCQWFIETNAQWEASSSDARRAALHQEIEVAAVSPGLIASVDGVAAGWCRVGPRTAQPRLARSTLVKKGTSLPLDDPTVWAVTCFVVRREFRGQSVARRLARAAVEFARAQGARVVEAYPIDASERKARANDLFVGSVEMFADIGFSVVARPRPGRAVMAYTP